MTLQEYQEARHEDLFLAVVSRVLSWEEVKNVCLYIPDYPNGIIATDVLKISVEQALLENNEPVTEENVKNIEEEVKRTITTHLEECHETILLKYGNIYIDISQMAEFDPEYEIKCLVPLAEYYSKEDYSFDEGEDGPYLSIDMEPFEEFVKDYSEGKFN